MKKILLILSLLFLLSPFFAYAQTCQNVAGGELDEYFCEPAPSSLPAGCQAESGGMDCTGSVPSGYTCSNNGTPCTSSASNPLAPPTHPTNPTNNVPAVSSQQAIPAGNLTYTPLEPIPGLTDSTAITNFPSLLQRLFQILFALGALLAVVRLVIGGIMYMTSSVVETHSNAKAQMTSSLYGLLILAGAYLILYTINPNLTYLNALAPQNGTAQQTQSPSTNGSTNTPNNAVSTTLGDWTGCTQLAPNSANRGAYLVASDSTTLTQCKAVCKINHGTMTQTGPQTTDQYQRQVIPYNCVLPTAAGTTTTTH